MPTNTHQPHLIFSEYPIGVTGKAWGNAEKALWLERQSIVRSYYKEVLAQLLPKPAEQTPPRLPSSLEQIQYGVLAYSQHHEGASDYPLYLFKSKQWDPTKVNVLITGGVHGYETSGVQGAIRFIHTQAHAYSDRVNFIIAPCLSPWGYETINRWNPFAIDPNRSFIHNEAKDTANSTQATSSPAPESQALMDFLATLKLDFTLHIDLHETTDSDNSEFRPALAARDGTSHDNWNIPDGFYLVGDTLKPQAAFQTAVIKGVAAVTHIAPADEQGRLIGAPLEQQGVINYPTKALGLCAGVTDAIYCTTTEVYPDSPKVDDENCILAQVAAITAALDYVLTV